ncbi:FAS1 domain-containing protein SELMODRAFT_448915 [Cornus florida]|uniref:FAS1 domain-containing protein SELMODRAFT_448915 n=1 Tax=Cornus florida TaxID=4283 RepID=UPI00289E430A|nr:FAS1 domain-containing protein SELMODRAFT_448915 [Cornus florida]
MATYMTLSILLMALIVSSSAIATDIPSRSQDLVIAIEEMQKANYFTFCMLLNMAPADLISGNVTFLMPNDRTLAKTMIAQNAVSDFLLRQSIPSPLLFDNIRYMPTGSIIPTLKPGFFLNVSNSGRKSFYLNNVRINSPNLCTEGSSIRCHGIDGVLQAHTVTPEHNSTLPSPTCSNSSSNCSGPNATASPPSPWWPSQPPPFAGISLSPTALPPTNASDSSKNSGPSQRLSYGGSLTFFTICLLTQVLI